MTARCPCCGHVSRKYFEATDRNRRVSAKSFPYYKCTSCLLVFLDPIPDDLSNYYPHDYYLIPESLEALAKNAEGERYKIVLVRRFVDSGRLLEIGSAQGGFTYLAKQAGFDVEAIEMDSRCCRILNDVIGIKAINSDDIVSALAGTEPYDVIVLWHVIEHLSNPWKSLEPMASRLLPNGLLIIAAPNPDSFQFRVLGRYWAHVDAPRHCSLIPNRLLEDQLRRFGMVKIFETTTDPGSLGWNIFGWRNSLMNLSTRPFGKWILGYAAVACSILAGPFERIEGLGSAYTMVFRKIAPAIRLEKPETGQQ